jgi:outer membrane protein assembly factor BamB
MKTVFLLLALTACFMVDSLRADDWYQWRGPHRNGISDEVRLLQQWPEDGPKQLWKAENLGGGYSTPVVVGDRLYMLTSKGLEDELLLALDVATGKQLWSRRIGKVGKPDQNPNYPGARSTPTVDGNHLYALGSDGDLVCLDRHAGAILWQINVRSEFAGKSGEWAYAESPLIDGDALICAPGGSEATLVCLDKNTGDVIWRSALSEGDDAAYASTIILEVGGLKQ